jgi:hypothetical protein
MSTIDMQAASAPTTPRLVGLRRLTAAAGLAGVILLFTGQGLLAAGGREPAFDASAPVIAEFFANRDATLYPIGSYLLELWVVVMAVFVTGTVVLLRHVEPAPRWRSTLAFAAGVAVVAAMANPGWDLAAFRTGEGLDPQLARLAFDLGNLGFANTWLMLGTFVAAVGLAILSADLPRWLGWWAVVAGVGMILARADWTSPMWLAPYALFWLWTVVFSVRLLLRPVSSGP